jgi:hypothetical protein
MTRLFFGHTGFLMKISINICTSLVLVNRHILLIRLWNGKTQTSTPPPLSYLRLGAQGRQVEII